MSKWHGKSILIVGGGLLQVPAVEIAHDLGLRVIVTDKNPDCACAKLADEFHELDTKDVAGHAVLVQRRQAATSLAGVFTEGASVEYTVAIAALAGGLPGLPPQVAYTISRKDLMRRTISVGNARSFLATCNYWEARNWAALWDKPFAVKAADNSGSRGFSRCAHIDELTREVFQRAASESYSGVVLLEEQFVPNPNLDIWEQSVETLWYAGQGYWLNWVDRPFIAHKTYAIEGGHYNPAMQPPETQRAVEQMCLQAGRDLEMTTGIFKCDVFLSDQGPRILETTARLSGGFDAQYTSPLAHGVDYIRGAMLLALGEAPAWEYFLPKWHRHACALADFPEPGKIEAIERGNASEAQIFLRARVGDDIPPYKSCVERPVFAVATGETRAVAEEAARRALASVRIKTRGNDK